MGQMVLGAALFLVLEVLTICSIQANTSSIYPPHPAENELLWNFGVAVGKILGTLPNRKCFPLLLTDGFTSAYTIYKFQELPEVRAAWGLGLFEMSMIGQDTNVTLLQLSRVIAQARQLRRMSWCVMVVLVSDDLAFLSNFAKLSLNGRLLVWSTKLLVVTRLPREDLVLILSSHWTFSMTNAMMLNVDQRSDSLSFYGERINVTALPYVPYWMSAEEGNATKYSGIDYNQLVTIADALNFTFQVLPSPNWKEVTDLVEARKSFLASIVYVVLPSRLERWDYTHTFDYAPLSFALAKPVLKPSWLSCYYPFSHQVWAGIFISASVVCITLLQITGSEVWRSQYEQLRTGAVIMEVLGSLLGQGLYGRLSTSRSNHILMASWLFFGVVVSTGYRGSLIASLTIPRQPSRPETLEELVTTVDRATIGSYGMSYKNFFTASDSNVYQNLGRLMHVGTPIEKGLADALKMKRAHVADRQYLELTVAQYFTSIDGTSPIYIGSEKIIPAFSAWPIPHDAPYKPILDKTIMAITEAGLYEQWRKLLLGDAARISRVKQREELSRNKQDLKPNNGELNPSGSLTITHAQGPMFLLLLGLVVGSIVLFAEKTMSTKYSDPKEKQLSREP